MTDASGQPAPDRLDDVEIPDDVAFRSHLRIAKRFEQRYAGDFAFVAGIGWHYWDGTRWAESQKGEVEQAVFDLIKSVWAESMRDRELQQDVRASQTANGTKGVLDQASKLASFAFVARDFDPDPYLLNTPSGTVDLRTFEVHPHDPLDRITKVTRGSFVPHARSEKWEAVLQRILPNDDVRGFLQRYVGVALVGQVLEHALVLLHGDSGQNGKSTFYETVAFALGDYAITAEPELFMHKDGTHPTGQMDLRGVRWVTTSETERGRRLATATVKRLTGGDPIRARRMRQDFVEFEPSHTAAMVTNHLPKVTGDDPALWRRVRVVDFAVRIPDSERDPFLKDALRLDADAVLMWAMRGYLDYKERGGLDEPSAVLAATAEYRRDSDVVGLFLEERYVLDGESAIQFGVVYEQWESWRVSNDGGPRISRKSFPKELARFGLSVEARSGNVRFVVGLRAPTDAAYGL